MAKKVYKSKYTGRMWNTEAEAISDSKKYFNDIEYRYYIKSDKVKHAKEYTIPFIPKKKITLSNAGVATGAILSTNLLDSIADTAVKTGLPIKTAIGLAVKESTLGNPTDDRSMYKILSPAKRKQFKVYGTGQHINKKGEVLNPRDLVNFYKDLDNPYISAILYATDNYKKIGKSYEQMLIDGEKYADAQRKGFEEKYSKHSVLYNAFKDYKSNPNNYNPGQPNYQQLVDKRANEVWNSPEIQSWYKTYSKRSLEEGGK